MNNFCNIRTNQEVGLCFSIVNGICCVTNFSFVDSLLNQIKMVLEKSGRGCSFSLLWTYWSSSPRPRRYVLCYVANFQLLVDCRIKLRQECSFSIFLILFTKILEICLLFIKTWRISALCPTLSKTNAYLSSHEKPSYPR